MLVLQFPVCSLVWEVITRYTLSSFSFDKASAKAWRGMQLGGKRTMIAGALPLIPVTGTRGEEPGEPFAIQKETAYSKKSNPEHQH